MIFFTNLKQGMTGSCETELEDYCEYGILRSPEIYLRKTKEKIDERKGSSKKRTVIVE